MFSLKSGIRKTISITLAAVMATTIFTGCSKTEPNQSDSIPVYTSVTSSITAPVDTPTDSNVLTGTDIGSGIQFKYWYEAPITLKKPSLATTLTDAITLTGSLFLSVDDLPIRQDADGKQYVISTNRQLCLEDGKMSLTDMHAFLRNSEGYKYYFDITDNASELVDAFGALELASGMELSDLSYERRTAKEDALDSIKSEISYDVYINSIPTDITYDVNTKQINITALLEKYALGEYSVDTNVLRLFTGYGIVDISITGNADAYTLKYSTGEEYATSVGEVTLLADAVLVSLDGLQKYLGYQVDVYDSFINIVTDNKDIITTTTLLDSSAIEESTYKPTEPTKPEEKPADTTSSSSTSSSTTNGTNSSSNSSSNSKPTQSSSSSSSTPNPLDPSSSSSSSSKPSTPSGSSSNSSSNSKPYVIKIPDGSTGEYFDVNGNPMPDNFDPSNGGYYNKNGNYIMTPAEHEAYERQAQEIANDPDSYWGQTDPDELLKILGIR
ncbi:MAG: hypothetical protein ACI4JY_07960 [Oscillospiraceae bacterium]